MTFPTATYFLTDSQSSQDAQGSQVSQDLHDSHDSQDLQDSLVFEFLATHAAKLTKTNFLDAHEEVSSTDPTSEDQENSSGRSGRRVCAEHCSSCVLDAQPAKVGRASPPSMWTRSCTGAALRRVGLPILKTMIRSKHFGNA